MSDVDAEVGDWDDFIAERQAQRHQEHQRSLKLVAGPILVVLLLASLGFWRMTQSSNPIAEGLNDLGAVSFTFELKVHNRTDVIASGSADYRAGTGWVQSSMVNWFDEEKWSSQGWGWTDSVLVFGALDPLAVSRSEFDDGSWSPRGMDPAVAVASLDRLVDGLSVQSRSTDADGRQVVSGFVPRSDVATNFYLGPPDRARSTDDPIQVEAAFDGDRLLFVEGRWNLPALRGADGQVLLTARPVTVRWEFDTGPARSQTGPTEIPELFDLS